jgi:hypothetical protein
MSKEAGMILGFGFWEVLRREVLGCVTTTAHLQW